MHKRPDWETERVALVLNHFKMSIWSLKSRRDGGERQMGKEHNKLQMKNRGGSKKANLVKASMEVCGLKVINFVGETL
jgi:hypothetical protein